MRQISICALTVMSLAWSVSSHAVLISHGDYARDTETRLEWLDVNLTAGISYDAILGGASGHIQRGWRYATGSEIDALATRYIGSPEQTYVGGVDFLQTLIMIGLLGPTFQRALSPDAPATVATLGYYNDGAADTDIGLGEFTVTVLVPNPAFGIPFTGRWSTFDDFLSPSTAAPQIGSFLVRSVPEPPAALLFLLAIAVYAAAGRSRTNVL